MRSATGVVERAGEKKWKDKVFYNFTLIDDDTLYRTGTVNYNLNTGDVVEFSYEETTYGHDVKELKVTGQQEVEKNKAKTSASRAASKAGKGNNREDYWSQKAEDDKTRQVIISYQAANKTAVDIVKMALEHDALSIGTAKAKKLDAIMAAVDELTDTIFEKYQNAGKEVVPESVVQEKSSLDD